jgi:NAD(P)-dependent dehydrogenase (short-subunit alcohol dehydrogenase family)
MQIDLAGQSAVILAHDELFVEPIEAALLRCGAAATIRDPVQVNSTTKIDGVLKSLGRLDVLIFVSPALSEPGRQPNAGQPTIGFADPVGTLDSFVEAASGALAAARGRIIVLGSALGILPARRNPLRALSDAMLFSLVREMAMRLGSRQVRINAIALGAIAGTTGSGLLVGNEAFLSHVADKRTGTVEDVTNAVLFLADPANTYMTGHILTVDGGWTAGFARDF